MSSPSVSWIDLGQPRCPRYHYRTTVFWGQLLVVDLGGKLFHPLTSFAVSEQAIYIFRLGDRQSHCILPAGAPTSLHCNETATLAYCPTMHLRALLFSPFLVPLSEHSFRLFGGVCLRFWMVRDSVCLCWLRHQSRLTCTEISGLAPKCQRGVYNKPLHKLKPHLIKYIT